MVKVYSKALDQTIKAERVFGKYTTKDPGPGLIVIAGIHGNEPSGVFALDRVFKKLHKHNIPIRGEFLALTGNLPALEKGERFIEEDMNRLCAEGVEERLLHKKEINTSEDAEMAELLQLVKDACDNCSGDVYFVDCHTTSAESNPFITLNDFPRNLDYVVHFPVFSITGMAQHLKGSFIDYMNRLGYTGFLFEAGQHDDLASIDNQEAAIWLSLAASGCIGKDQIPDFQHWTEVLKKTTIEGHKIFTAVYKHKIAPADEFVMAPGYVNFEKVSKGQLLANDKNGPIYSEWDGRVLMPLYQKKGDEGFFIVEERQN